jgi:hypothetical protein
MPYFLKILFDICLFRKGPEDLPANKNLMLSIIAASIVVSVWLGTKIYDTQISVLSSIAGLFFSFAFTKILLNKRPERFMQTFTAMLGTVTLINLISLPIVSPLSNDELNANLTSILSFLSFGLFIWIVIIYGFIFSRAMSSTFSQGIAISIGYTVLSIIILQLVLAFRMSS